MAFKNLPEFILALDSAGELIRVAEYVNPILEMTEIVDRLSKTPAQNKAVLFENTGTDFPVLMNMMGSEQRMAMALGVSEIDDARKGIEVLFKELMAPKDALLDKLKMLPQLSRIAGWMPKVVKKKAACQEVVLQGNDIDLFKLPVLKCWPEDGGRFMTLPIVHTKHPVDGTRNVGLYRVQLFEKNMTGMHWHKHKVSAGHFNEYKKLGKRMPVAIALGGDPLYSYAATAPMPPNIDEYMLAGFLRKKKVELVSCITQPEIQVPIDADIIIEGYVDPEEDFILEGPFGDHTGYYSLADYYPRFHVTAITHRKDAIYPATIVGIPPQEDAWIGKATERIFLAPIKMTLIPEIIDMELPVEGVFHNLTIVQIKKEFPGHAQKVMNAMWGAGQMMFNKILVVVDEDANITDYEGLAKLFTEHVNPATDIYTSTGPMDVLDHSCSAFAFGGKVCIDATRKFEEEIPLGPPPERLKSFSRAGPLEGGMNTPAGGIGELEAIKSQYPSIKQLNTSYLRKGISIAFVAIKKDRKDHVQDLATEMFRSAEFESVKCLLFVDDIFDINDTADVVWRVTNNIDARRDTHIYDAGENGISHVAFDGTRKTKEFDNFHREWPNIITSDEATIKAVDEKWDKLGLGPFIESPSKKYLKQQYSKGAVVQPE